MCNLKNQSINKLDELALTKMQATKTENGVNLIQASMIEQKPIYWLWEGWLAAGKFHVLAGVAGTGKSTIAMSLAATISSGGVFPDGKRAEKGDVVIWSGEDDPEDTLAPRLEAMGADLDRIHFVGTVNNEGAERHFDLKKDIQGLHERIAELPNLKLLVLDPIVSAIKKDANSNGEVRQDLTPVVQIASELGFAALGITHFSKDTVGKDPLERVTGSLAFGAVPRVVWAVTRVKYEDESDKRIFVRIKNNIGKDGNGFSYCLEQMKVSGIEASKVVWGEAIFGSASKLFLEAEGLPKQKRSNVEDCCELVQHLLADGPMTSIELVQICKEAGFSDATLRNAKNKLGIKPERVGGFAANGEWQVSLPKVLLDYPSKNITTLAPDRHLSHGNWIEREV
jgi:putative DNA primase/helicase